jgi:transcription antitermination protein NusB
LDIPKMSPRRRARAVALQVLYAMDTVENVDPGLALATHLREFGAGEDKGEAHLREEYAFDEKLAGTLVRGVCAHRVELDEILARLSQNWRVERLARVDRNVLRLALFELVHCQAEVPTRVAINEAVELAKRFGSEEAPAFVNGLLESALDLLGITP